MDSRCAWAANRLAPMRARAGDHEGAARALQVVLRVSPRNAGAWEALGASYTVLGRHSAALKAFERALELSEDSGDGARAYAAAQTGHIQLTLGSSVDAAESYEKALSDGVDRVAALFGLARAHAHYAEGALRLGAPGRAADSLREARRAASRAVDALGESATATFWKLLGDVHHLTARVNDPAHGKDVEATLAERARGDGGGRCLRKSPGALPGRPGALARSRRRASPQNRRARPSRRRHRRRDVRRRGVSTRRRLRRARSGRRARVVRARLHRRR